MKIEKRTESLKNVRGMKKIPGVLFGKTIEPISIQVDEKVFHDTLNEKGLTQTFEVKLGNKKHLVYIKDIQRDIVKHNDFLNIKLQKVSKDDTITTNIPLNIIGREKVEKPGVMVSVPNDSLEVEYNVGSGVSHIDVDVSALRIGDSLAVKDLTIPEGLKVHTDSEQTVVSVVETHYDEAELETEEVDPEDVEIITEKSEKDEE
ncbi:50S ribosomal protein L25 [Hujiaoplasma nucleasis]|uniref:50S ribosomal protein L25 n=1 Tax=Hujiaoplasma nucleasis TaxID=2725268 RepID=A0A7L6N8M4_9MOLU|nr:50S ribosomal protein L25 [Hujiaoplasma nucleasis]QLY40879.1 50S ribosomal protein L25 [Hujiaoplasma nucleasis]